MRLTIFGPGHPFRGGIAQTTTALVQALVDEGHDCLYLTPRRQYPKWIYPGANDTDPLACPRLRCSEAAFAPTEPWTWVKARRAAVAHGDDAWVFPYWTWVWAPMWRFLLSETGRPATVSIVHNPQDHESGRLQRFAAGSVLARCEGLFAHARVLAEGLGSQFPKTPVGFHHLPAVCALDTQPIERSVERQRLGFSEHERLALFVGLIRPYKGVDVLLDAAAGLQADCRWRFVIAGEPWGALGTELKSRAHRLGLDERVRFIFEWVSELDLHRLLTAADLVVLPYRHGTQSAVVPQALVRGVPVLTTRVGGIPEVVEHGVSGLVVEPDSADDLRRAMAGLGDDELLQLRSGALKAGRGLSWVCYARKLTALLQRVVD